MPPGLTTATRLRCTATGGHSAILEVSSETCLAFAAMTVGVRLHRGVQREQAGGGLVRVEKR